MQRYASLSCLPPRALLRRLPDTRKNLLQAGTWERVDLVQPPEETWFATIPHVFGTLTK
jgi:hypothetical protein